jgi:hypothetical protein
MRGGAVKAGPLSRGGKPWRVESPGELRASVDLNSPRGVADSRGEQTPEGGDASDGLVRPGELRSSDGGSVAFRRRGFDGSSGASALEGRRVLGVSAPGGRCSKRAHEAGASAAVSGVRLDVGQTPFRRRERGVRCGAAPDEGLGVSASGFGVGRWSGWPMTGSGVSAAGNGVGRTSGAEERDLGVSALGKRDSAFGRRMTDFTASAVRDGVRGFLRAFDGGNDVSASEPAKGARR